MYLPDGQCYTFTQKDSTFTGPTGWTGNKTGSTAEFSCGAIHLTFEDDRLSELRSGTLDFKFIREGDNSVQIEQDGLDTIFRAELKSNTELDLHWADGKLEDSAVITLLPMGTGQALGRIELGGTSSQFTYETDPKTKASRINIRAGDVTGFYNFDQASGQVIESDKYIFSSRLEKGVSVIQATDKATKRIKFWGQSVDGGTSIEGDSDSCSTSICFTSGLLAGRQRKVELQTGNTVESETFSYDEKGNLLRTVASTGEAQ